MNTLKIGISGVRGVVGRGLTPTVALEFGQAYGTFVNCGKVAVGQDTRPSGSMLKSAIICGLLYSGCSVVDIGIVPTPTLFLYVRKNKLDGGVVVTASHNPSEWNGIKFAEPDGTFLNQFRMEKLFDLYYKKGFRQISWDVFKDLVYDDKACSQHIEEVLRNLDVKSIQKHSFKVGLDSCNGAGSNITREFLMRLGCKVFSINDIPNGKFTRDPEPLAENLGALCRLVKRKRLDIGFAQDPDADRVSLVSEKGVAIGEEYTQALATRAILSKKRGIIATNISSSLMMDDIAKEFKTRLIRTKVGEANVAEQMRKRGVLIGGEGNGGVIFPKINSVRDSIVAIGIILEYLADSQKKLSKLTEEIPHYDMVKGKIRCPLAKTSEVLEMLRTIYRDSKIDLTDGVKIQWPDKWIQIRPSNTEDIVRIIAEAKDRKEAYSLYLEVCKQIEDFIKR